MITSAFKFSAASILLSTGIALSASSPAAAFDYNSFISSCSSAGQVGNNCINLSEIERRVKRGNYRQLIRSFTGKSTSTFDIKNPPTSLNSLNSLSRNWKK